MKAPSAPRQLPDGSSIRELNAYETDYLYHEIFEQNIYLRNGIELGRGAAVFDVGANIGLFTLFIQRRFPGTRAHAFEPIPAAYECLAANTAALSTVRTSNVALSERNGEALFIYYPGYSVISGFHADSAKDSTVIQEGMRAAGTGLSGLEIKTLIDQRLSQRVALRCPTQTLSCALRESGEEKIDLLKIDAEGAEAEILGGIEDADWPRIRQAVLEIHDARSVESIRALMAAKGFLVTVEKEPNLADAGIHNLYARR